MFAIVDRPAAIVDAPRDPSPIAALEGALEDLAAVVAALSPEAYNARLLPNASGSIGEHVRHCLDHVSALVSAAHAASRVLRGNRSWTHRAA